MNAAFPERSATQQPGILLGCGAAALMRCIRTDAPPPNYGQMIYYGFVGCGYGEGFFREIGAFS